MRQGIHGKTLLWMAVLLSLLAAFGVSAQSPSSLAGKTIQLTATSGTFPFASSGTGRFLPSAIDSTYAIVPISGAISASSGTYSYTKNGANTAVLSAVDSGAGAVSTAVTFSTPTSGTYVQSSASFPGSSQTGTFFLFSGPSLPSISGFTITVTITTDLSPFAGSGAYQIFPAVSGNTYQIIALSGPVLNSSGTYTYSQNSTNTGLFAFNDSVAGSGLSSQLSFNTSVSGTVFLRGSGAGYQTGTFVVTTNPASISANPTPLTVVTGAPANFTVVAGGTPPFRYQWRKDGTNLLNATNSSFVIASTVTNNAGNYSVTVSNAAGGTLSPAASLTVLVPPGILVQPTNVVVGFGSNALLSVVFSGTPPVGVQWQRYGTNLVGANNASLALSSVTTNDAGNYRVIGSNSAGSITSSVATVTVDLTASIRPSFSSNRWDKTNGFSAQAALQVGRSYRFQTSSNLTLWQDVTNLVAPSVGLLLKDSSATNRPVRFYRLISP